MPTGSFRFRQNKRFVNSTFRGARRDTFPYIPYPTEGRVLDLSSFTFESAEVADISGENNNAALYSGRGVNLAGSDYVELPDVGTTKSITVLARSSTDTTLYATDDATQTEDATAALVADGTWQEVTLTFASAITGKIRIGSDGTNFYSGDLADAECYDSANAILDQFYFNEHTDTAASGLDGLPCIGREGNIGQYVGCAAVIQVPGDVGGLTPPQVLGMNFNERISLGAPINGTSSPTFETFTVNDPLGFTGTRTSAGAAYGGWNIPVDLESGDSVIVRGTVSSDQSPSISFRSGSGGGAATSNASILSNGSFEVTLTATATSRFIAFTDSDTPTTLTVSNFSAELVSGPAQPQMLVPESSTSGNDALGNAIENLRTNKTFNADGSGRWEVGDAASLAGCKSWACRYYHTTGTADVILDLGGPTIEATSGNALTSTGITSPTYYVNNVAGTALSAGWNSICVTTATATDCGPISGGDPTALESDVKVYNLELTAEQVETLP